MLVALVLVCSLVTTPDLRQCDTQNAVDVMRVPERFAMPLTCFMHGQAYVAESAIRIRDDEQVKVVCTHEKATS